jgi:hypothetical protein
LDFLAEFVISPPLDVSALKARFFLPDLGARPSMSALEEFAAELVPGPKVNSTSDSIEVTISSSDFG